MSIPPEGTLQKKVCMVGSFAVGKTSLVARLVEGVFSEKYLTTVGVKIDRREMEVDSQRVLLLLWDLAGEDRFQRVQASYLRGAAGLLLVVDGTRRETVATALEVLLRVTGERRGVPAVVAVNKADLSSTWEVDSASLKPFLEAGIPVLHTSARTGEGVEEAFSVLVRAILAGSHDA